MAHFGQFWGFCALFVIFTCHLVTQVDGDSRISGGVDASMGDFPYMVGFKSMKSGNENQVFAAIIVDYKRVVMSAAMYKEHCKDNKCKLVAGTLDRATILNPDGKDGVDGVQVREVTGSEEHPCYKGGDNPHGGSYSLTLLELNKPFTEEKGKIETAWFHSKNSSITDVKVLGEQGADLWIAGWGATKEAAGADEYPPLLQKLKVEVTGGCSGFTVCVKSNVGAACKGGDSGGPLLVDLKGEGQEKADGKNEKFVAGFYYLGRCDAGTVLTYIDLTKHVCFIGGKHNEEAYKPKCTPTEEPSCPFDFKDVVVDHTTQAPITTPAASPTKSDEGDETSHATNLSSPQIGLLLFVATIWTLWI